MRKKTIPKPVSDMLSAWRLGNWNHLAEQDGIERYYQMYPELAIMRLVGELQINSIENDHAIQKMKCIDFDRKEIISSILSGAVNSIANCKFIIGDESGAEILWENSMQLVGGDVGSVDLSARIHTQKSSIHQFYTSQHQPKFLDRDQLISSIYEFIKPKSETIINVRTGCVYISQSNVEKSTVCRMASSLEDEGFYLPVSLTDLMFTSYGLIKNLKSDIMIVELSCEINIDVFSLLIIKNKFEIDNPLILYFELDMDNKYFNKWDYLENLARESAFYNSVIIEARDDIIMIMSASNLDMFDAIEEPRSIIKRSSKIHTQTIRAKSSSIEKLLTCCFSAI